MDTVFMLMAKYKASPTIPLDKVREDFFAGMSKTVFKDKIESGEIPLPLVRMTEGQKSPLAVPTTDLAIFLDLKAETARKEAAKKL
ncbi:MAG: pyocin activator PrtN family protein [Pseudomonadota bacterium]|nr:pyocin activator PrtN family protein [Pseudomonadota bacterium]